MKPYQVNLFGAEDRIPESPPPEPFFLYDNKRYINFLNLDCYYLKNSEYLKETAKLNIESRGIGSASGKIEVMNNLLATMSEIKRMESLLFFPDEISAFFAIFSICVPTTTYFVDYETSASVNMVLQGRNVEYYDHRDLNQLQNLMANKSGRLIIIDGIYEWLGNISPVNGLVNIARANECIIVANEINSFGLLGRDGRGFIDLFNIYDDINIEIGSFNKFLGGFGCYIGGKKYLINKIRDNIIDVMEPIPLFMVAVNLAGVDFIKEGKISKMLAEQLWKNSRYFISRLLHLGYKTLSETPLIAILFNNNEEAGAFKNRLFSEQVLVTQKRERIRLCLSAEHNKEDLDYCLEKFEIIGKDLGIIK